MALGVADDPDPQRGFRFPAELTLFDRAGVVPLRTRFAGYRVALISATGDLLLGVDDRVLSVGMATE